MENGHFIILRSHIWTPRCGLWPGNLANDFEEHQPEQATRGPRCSQLIFGKMYIVSKIEVAMKSSKIQDSVLWQRLQLPIGTLFWPGLSWTWLQPLGQLLAGNQQVLQLVMSDDDVFTEARLSRCHVGLWFGHAGYVLCSYWILGDFPLDSFKAVPPSKNRSF